MKVKEFQVYDGILDFTPGTDEKTYTVATGRRNGILEIVCVTVNPRGTDKAKGVRRVMKIKGTEVNLDTASDVNGGDSKSWFDTIYIANGTELGLRIDGEKVDSTVRVFVQYLWHPDEL